MTGSIRVGSSKQKMIVIGAGVIGAAAAYELAARGADVLVIDAGGARATEASFGWINASFYETPEYHALRTAGMGAYHRLEAKLALPINWCGSLAWEFEGAELDEQFQTLAGTGYAARIVGRADIENMEPDLGAPPDRAIHFADEAAVEPDLLTQQLLRASGARVLRGVFVTGFDQSQGRVTAVETTAGRFEGDQVLVAAGTGTENLLARLGIPLPMLHRPALVLKTAPAQLNLRHVLATDFGEVRQLPDGSLIMPAAIGHQSDASETLTHPDQAAEAGLTRLRALFPETQLHLAEMSVAHRPVPEDGFPAIGQAAPGLYVAVMHSGITLAALAGEMIALEMLDATPLEALSAFRPHRFQ